MKSCMGRDGDLTQITLDHVDLSELALKAHELEDTPGEAIEDRDRIKELLGPCNTTDCDSA